MKRRKTSIESDDDDVFLENVGSENDVVEEGNKAQGLSFRIRTAYVI